MAVLDLNNRVLISGDPVQLHGRIFMFGENRNMNDYVRSLEKLVKMTDEFDELWPSHADIPIKPDVIEKLLDGTRRVMKKEIQGNEVELFGRKAMAYDLGFTTMLCDE